MKLTKPKVLKDKPKTKPKRDMTLAEVIGNLKRGEVAVVDVPMILTKCGTRCGHTNPGGFPYSFEVDEIKAEFVDMPKFATKIPAA